MSKRKLCIIPILIILLAILSACGPRSYVNRFNIKTSYKEWVKEIGLFSHKNIKVKNYEEDGNEITVSLEYDNGLVGYEELCDIVNKHNKFVENNSDYFKPDTSIFIINEYASEQNISNFGNFTSDDSFALELGRDSNAKIQCMTIDLNDATCEKDKDDNIALDIPVISLGYKGMEAPHAEMYEFLSEFKNAEQIILYYCDTDNNLLVFDKNETCKYIKNILPNVEIYTEVLDDQQNEYHLERLD